MQSRTTFDLARHLGLRINMLSQLSKDHYNDNDDKSNEEAEVPTANQEAEVMATEEETEVMATDAKSEEVSTVEEGAMN